MYSVHCVQYHQTRDSYLVTMQVLSNYKASYDTVNIKLTVQGSYTIQISIIKLRLFLDTLLLIFKMWCTQDTQYPDLLGETKNKPSTLFEDAPKYTHFSKNYNFLGYDLLKSYF